MSVVCRVWPCYHPPSPIASPPLLSTQADGCCGLDSYPLTKLGSYARLKANVDRFRDHRRSEGGIVLTVDAGDWFSGSVFSSLGPSPASSAAPELEYFAAAGVCVCVWETRERETRRLLIPWGRDRERERERKREKEAERGKERGVEVNGVDVITCVLVVFESTSEGASTYMPEPLSITCV